MKIVTDVNMFTDDGRPLSGSVDMNIIQNTDELVDHAGKKSKATEVQTENDYEDMYGKSPFCFFPCQNLLIKWPKSQCQVTLCQPCRR